MKATNHKTEITNLTIRGEDLTRIVRDFMLSDMPTKAWRVLTKGLVGDNGLAIEKYAPKILDGTMKLVGDERGMSIKKCTAKNYVKTLKYIYAGRVRVDKSWWRPRAVVTDLGPDDAEFADKLTRFSDEYEPNLDPIQKFAKMRVAFYARRNENVFKICNRKFEHTSVLNDLYGRYVIFERASEPPFWWDEETDTTAALNDFLLNGHRLTKASWSAAFGHTVEDDAEELEDEGLMSDDEQRQREEDEKHAAEDNAFETEVTQIRNAVIEQANGDFMDLKLEDGTLVASVPRAPFMHWALSRSSLKHHAPAWKPVASSGLKMQNDDPYHTDWFYGATIVTSPSEDEKESNNAWGKKWYHYDHNGALNKAAFHEMFELQTSLGECSCGVVVSGSDVTGVIGLDIVVLPNLDPKYVDRVLTAKAVITQAGGKLAHLSTVALERGVPIMLVEDACTRFIEGETVTVYPSEGEIRLHVVRE